MFVGAENSSICNAKDRDIILLKKCDIFTSVKTNKEIIAGRSEWLKNINISPNKRIFFAFFSRNNFSSTLRNRNESYLIKEGKYHGKSAILSPQNSSHVVSSHYISPSAKYFLIVQYIRCIFFLWMANNDYQKKNCQNYNLHLCNFKVEWFYFKGTT